jgi:helix-turn-helix protein
MTELRVKLGSKLRQQREARDLNISDVSRVTKIPERSVTLLEAGEFDSLPGDVFVRGFLRSYCRCVGLDVDSTLRDYEELAQGTGTQSRRETTLTRPGTRRVPVSGAAPAVPAAAPAAAAAAPAAAAPTSAAPEEAAPVEEERSEESKLFAALAAAGRGTSRISLTLAVIILVIVATLALSLLLRRPGHVGDGVSFTNRGSWGNLS